MKVLVCGSRGWKDGAAVYDRLYRLSGPLTILHGGAKGADMLAANFGVSMGYEVFEFPADWETHGKKAGILRNLQMLDEQPDLVIAFQLNDSRGTQHTINEARRRGIPVEVHTPIAAPDAQASSPGPTHTEQESE